MARQPRIEYPGALYHVIARGNQRRDVYHDDMDRLRYLATLRAYKQRYGFRLYAYVLMTNHLHLLVVSAAERLAATRLVAEKSTSQV